MDQPTDNLYEIVSELERNERNEKDGKDEKDEKEKLSTSVIMEKPFAKRLLEGTLCSSELEKLSASDLVTIVGTCSYLNLNSDLYFDEFLWKIGGDEHLTLSYFRELCNLKWVFRSDVHPVVLDQEMKKRFPTYIPLGMLYIRYRKVKDLSIYATHGNIRMIKHTWHKVQNQTQIKFMIEIIKAGKYELFCDFFHTRDDEKFLFQISGFVFNSDDIRFLKEFLVKTPSALSWQEIWYTSRKTRKLTREKIDLLLEHKIELDEYYFWILCHSGDAESIEYSLTKVSLPPVCLKEVGITLSSCVSGRVPELFEKFYNLIVNDGGDVYDGNDGELILALFDQCLHTNNLIMLKTVVKFGYVRTHLPPEKLRDYVLDCEILKFLVDKLKVPEEEAAIHLVYTYQASELEKFLDETKMKIGQDLINISVRYGNSAVIRLIRKKYGKKLQLPYDFSDMNLYSSSELQVEYVKAIVECFELPKANLYIRNMQNYEICRYLLSISYPFLLYADTDSEDEILILNEPDEKMKWTVSGVATPLDSHSCYVHTLRKLMFKNRKEKNFIVLNYYTREIFGANELEGGFE